MTVIYLYRNLLCASLIEMALHCYFLNQRTVGRSWFFVRFSVSKFLPLHFFYELLEDNWLNGFW